MKTRRETSGGGTLGCGSDASQGGKTLENLIVGAIVVACLIYVVFRARRTFKSNGCGCGCGGSAEKKSCGCAGCNGCNGGESAESSDRGCERSE